MPSVALFEQACKVSWDDYFPLLRYQILSNPDLTTIYQVNQEMAVRIKEAIKTAQSVDELVEITGVDEEEAKKVILAAREHWFTEENN